MHETSSSFVSKMAVQKSIKFSRVHKYVYRFIIYIHTHTHTHTVESMIIVLMVNEILCTRYLKPEQKLLGEMEKVSI